MPALSVGGQAIAFSDGYHYTYDSEGNILTVDGGGNGQHIYDAFNNRVHVATSAGTFEYAFDYAGRRVSAWQNPSAGYKGNAYEGRAYWDG